MQNPARVVGAREGEEMTQNLARRPPQPTSESQIRDSPCNRYVLGDAFRVGFPAIAGPDVDLVFTSVPDLEESDATCERDYLWFLRRCVDEIARVVKDTGFVALAQTDRRTKGHILPKHLILTESMLARGFIIKDHKILIKGRVDAVSLFRLTYANLLVFTRRGTVRAKKRRGEYLRDCWICENTTHEGVWLWDERFVETVVTTLTDETEFVFDPFAGRGSVLRCCERTNRRYLGIEKNAAIYAPEYVKGGSWQSVKGKLKSAKTDLLDGR